MVVDASVWISYLLPQDVHHSISRQWLSRRLAEGGQIAAPILLLAEVAGAIARQSGLPRTGHQVVADIKALPGVRLLAIDDLIGATAARFAADLRLRGADATYVAVAHQLNTSLVTWDREQSERAAAVITTTVPTI